MNRAIVPFVIVGGISLVAGGILSAASAGAPSYLASWAVAYLVLVSGVAQLVLGIGQGLLAARPVSARTLAAEVLVFNLANIATLAGTLLAWRGAVYAGAALMVAAMVLFAWAVRGAADAPPPPDAPGASPRDADRGRRRLLYGFRAMIVILLVSAPTGLVLAALRS